MRQEKEVGGGESIDDDDVILDCARSIFRLEINR